MAKLLSWNLPDVELEATTLSCSPYFALLCAALPLAFLVCRHMVTEQKLAWQVGA